MKWPPSLQLGPFMAGEKDQSIRARIGGAEGQRETLTELSCQHWRTRSVQSTMLGPRLGHSKHPREVPCHFTEEGTGYRSTAQGPTAYRCQGQSPTYD